MTVRVVITPNEHNAAPAQSWEAVVPPDAQRDALQARGWALMVCPVRADGRDVAVFVDGVEVRA